MQFMPHFQAACPTGLKSAGIIHSLVLFSAMYIPQRFCPSAKALISIASQTLRGLFCVYHSSNSLQPLLPRTTRARSTPIAPLPALQLAHELLRLGTRQDHRERGWLRRWTTPIRLGQPCTGWVPALAGGGRGDDGRRWEVFFGG